MRVALYVLLSLLLAAPAAAAAEKLEKLVTVSGEATVSAVPDAATIRIGVSSQGKTARAASETNAKDMSAVIAAMKDAGIPGTDIQTSSLSLQPQYDQKQNVGSRLVAFQVNNIVTIKLRDIGRLATVIDRAIAAGANEMSGIEFEVSEHSKLLDQARAAAVADARRKAELYAGAASMKIGRVMAISEEGQAPPRRYAPMLRAGAPATPISPGEQTLRAVVTVSFELTS
jgi:uncharacterized protein YggE